MMALGSGGIKAVLADWARRAAPGHWEWHVENGPSGIFDSLSEG